MSRRKRPSTAACCHGNHVNAEGHISAVDILGQLLSSGPNQLRTFRERFEWTRANMKSVRRAAEAHAKLRAGLLEIIATGQREQKI